MSRMKQCARCKNIIQNDNEMFCPKCGGTQFNYPRSTQQKQSQPQSRPVQPHQQQSNMNNVGGATQMPSMDMYNQQTSGYNQPTSGYNQPMYNQQPVQPQVYTQQQMPMQSTMQIQQAFNQSPAQPTRAKKVSKKERQRRETEALFAIKAARERGENLTKEEYYRQMGWEEAAQQIQQKPMKSQQQSYGMQQNIGNTEAVTVKDWIITLILMLIPILNIVLALKNMNSISVDMSKRNFYKAFLIYYIAALIISIAISFVI